MMILGDLPNNKWSQFYGKEIWSFSLSFLFQAHYMESTHVVDASVIISSNDKVFILDSLIPLDMFVTYFCVSYDRFSFSTMFFAHSKCQFFVLCDIYGPIISGGYLSLINIVFPVLCRGKYSEHSWSLCAAYMVICSFDNKLKLHG